MIDRRLVRLPVDCPLPTAVARSRQPGSTGEGPKGSRSTIQPIAVTTAIAGASTPRRTAPRKVARSSEGRSETQPTSAIRKKPSDASARSNAEVLLVPIAMMSCAFSCP